MNPRRADAVRSDMPDAPPRPLARSMFVSAVRWSVRLLVVALAIALAFAATYRDDPDTMSRITATLTWLQLLIEVFSLHVGLVLLPVLALAVLLRQRCSAVALAVLLATMLGPPAWAMIRPTTPAIPAASAGEPLRIFSANKLFKQSNHDALLEQIRAADPDIVLLQEYSWYAENGLAQELLKTHPHSVRHARRHAFGQATFSKLPFAKPPEPFPRVGVWEDRVQIRVTVEHDGRRIDVWNVHPVPPAGLSSIALQRKQVAWLAASVEGRWDSPDKPAAIVLGGDFNAPLWSTMMRDLRAVGIRDAHAEAAHGRGGTWPSRWKARGVPVVRLDQFGIMGPITPHNINIGKHFGSDHRAVWLDVVLRSAPNPPIP